MQRSRGHRDATRGKQKTGGKAGRRPRAAAAVLGLAFVVACSDSTAPPAAAADEVCPTASVPLCTDVDAAARARDGVADAVTRSTPAIDNPPVRAAFTTALGQLEAALAAGNVTRGREALRQSRAGVASARGQLGAFPGDAADLAAIELVLDRVGPLLGTSG